jgi:hypothetical protein
MLLSNVNLVQSQTSKANNLRQEGRLEAAIKAYKKQYKKSPKKWRNTYDLACAYALTFQKDSAFQYLNIALKDDHSLWSLADSDLFALIDDPRWIDVENKQMERFQKNKKLLKNPNYAKKLLNIILKDQALDYYIDQAKTYFMKEGNPPQWYYPLGAYKQQIAQGNFVLMQQLIETHGWPKYSNVGKLAADAPLLVINHHKDDSVREKYISQIKQICLEKEGSCTEYAKIQDRILVSENKPQIYGMQFRYNAERSLEPFPINDPEYVDQRREKIGLEPLRVYLKRKINYDWVITQKKTDSLD